MKKYIAPEAEAITLMSADCITFSVGEYKEWKDSADFGDWA